MSPSGNEVADTFTPNEHFSNRFILRLVEIKKCIETNIDVCMMLEIVLECEFLKLKIQPHASRQIEIVR